jgi:class 3 adenylate cyclase
MQGGWARRVWDGFVLGTVRGAVNAVRYQPQHTALVLACGASQPEVPEPLVRWWADLRVQPEFLALGHVPHAVARWVAGGTARLFGPTGSVLVRWASGVGAATADRATAQPIERVLRGRPHPGLLVPHPHDVVVLAADMRGFSHLTRQLHDTQYLSDLIGDYLTALTHVVERGGGIVIQYTGDGLLAVFLPELASRSAPGLLDLLVQDVCPALHRSFDELHGRWRAEWRRSGRPTVAIGLGVGASFGRATIGFLGAAGKKQVGVIGEPVNVAAYLCSQARAGTTLVDCGSFGRAGAALPAGRFVRLRSKKPHQRIAAVSLSREPPPTATLPSPR